MKCGLKIMTKYQVFIHIIELKYKILSSKNGLAEPLVSAENRTQSEPKRFGSVRPKHLVRSCTTTMHV